MIKLQNLRCEYQTNPLGLDTLTPRLSWELDDPRRAARQTACQIVTDNGGDTGKVKSDQSIHIPYSGPALRSRQRCVWKVRVWDANGKRSPWSAPAFFEMGLLNRTEWTAQWIGSPLVGGPRTTSPCPFLRKTFAVRGPVKSARLYVTALGLYEFYLNGQRAKPVGEAIPRRSEGTPSDQRHEAETTSGSQSKRAGGGVCGIEAA